MKRLTFIGSLLGLTGIAKAQQWKECKPTVALSGNASLRNGKLSWCSSRALNDQCPVCGTMAEKYHRTISGDCSSARMVDRITVCPPPTIDPTERVTRCKRCNAAFWQDAV